MTPVPAMSGTIERRLLINYRVDPSVLEPLVPSPFRPQLVNGMGMAGICLIRLGDLRPLGLPAWGGLRTENAAHRVAVEWDGPGGPSQGVYIPRRDTSSKLTVLLGGRFFPGEHHRARFQVRETPDHFDVAFESLDGTARVSVAAKSTTDLDPGSVFSSLSEASSFFEGAPSGIRPLTEQGVLKGSSFILLSGTSIPFGSSTWNQASSPTILASRQDRWSSTAPCSCVTSQWCGGPERCSGANHSMSTRL